MLILNFLISSAGVFVCFLIRAFKKMYICFSYLNIAAIIEIDNMKKMYICIIFFFLWYFSRVIQYVGSDMNALYMKDMAVIECIRQSDRSLNIENNVRYGSYQINWI